MCAINGKLVCAEYKYWALLVNVKKIQYSCECDALQELFYKRRRHAPSTRTARLFPDQSMPRLTCVCYMFLSLNTFVSRVFLLTNVCKDLRKR